MQNFLLLMNCGTILHHRGPSFELFSCIYCVNMKVLITAAISRHLQRFPCNSPGRSRTRGGVSSPHLKHHKSPRLLPLLMRQQLMCIWGRLIVTVFTGISMRCSSDGVNPPGPEDAIQLSTISAHSISTSNTHSKNFNTSSSTLCTPPSSPHPASKRQDSLASCLSPYSIYSPT